MASGGEKFELAVFLTLQSYHHTSLCKLYSAVSSTMSSAWLSKVLFALWETNCSGGAQYDLIVIIHSFIPQSNLCILHGYVHMSCNVLRLY